MFVLLRLLLLLLYTYTHHSGMNTAVHIEEMTSPPTLAECSGCACAVKNALPGAIRRVGGAAGGGGGGGHVHFAISAKAY